MTCIGHLRRGLGRRVGDRLECLLELPKRKILPAIEAADAVRAKEMLGGHTSLLVHCPNQFKLWALNDVESFVKDLIDRCGKKGGLMLAIRMPDKATIQDMRAMMKSLQEYGRY